MLENAWRIWAKALGSKEGLSNKEADKAAIIRTVFFVVAIITNLLISINIIRRWNIL